MGETLTASAPTSGISDTDGLSKATFGYQWLADDADISDATSSSYTLVADDEGKVIKVRVSFTDGASNAESLTSAATAAVAAAQPPLTASYHNSPESHDGNAAFTFELRFGEEPASGFSYTTVRDHALTITEGSVSNVRRLESGKNVRWEITVTPASDADVAIAVNATTDCTADGAICNADGGKLSGGLELVVPGPQENSAATGAPAIIGTARVGETLTASTTGISDADGLSNATFGYQWLADDTDISGATSSSYTLVADDEGKAIKVRVSFTDNEGNAESLTSEATATAAVAAAQTNSAATGAPAISGTARVGETLTASTSGIADTDRLTKVSYSYQWIRNDGSSDTDIQDATGASYGLVDADEGKTIKVKVSFTDDAGNEETLTSAATGEIASAPLPLTVSSENNPASHNGTDVFTFQIRFSEEPASGFSYKTLRDHAFTVTGGAVTGVRRLEPPGNVRWEITVAPTGDGRVTVVLPITTDCDAEGAVCAGDGRRLSNRLELTVPGPG